MYSAGKDKLFRLDEERQRRRQQRADEAVRRLERVGKETLQILSERTEQPASPRQDEAYSGSGRRPGGLSRVLLEAAATPASARSGIRGKLPGLGSAELRGEALRAMAHFNAAMTTISGAVVDTAQAGLRGGLEAAGKRVDGLVDHLTGLVRGDEIGTRLSTLVEASALGALVRDEQEEERVAARELDEGTGSDQGPPAVAEPAGAGEPGEPLREIGSRIASVGRDLSLEPARLGEHAARLFEHVRSRRGGDGGGGEVETPKLDGADLPGGFLGLVGLDVPPRAESMVAEAENLLRVPGAPWPDLAPGLRAAIASATSGGAADPSARSRGPFGSVELGEVAAEITGVAGDLARDLDPSRRVRAALGSRDRGHTVGEPGGAARDAFASPFAAGADQRAHGSRARADDPRHEVTGAGPLAEPTRPVSAATSASAPAPTWPSSRGDEPGRGSSPGSDMEGAPGTLVRASSSGARDASRSTGRDRSATERGVPAMEPGQTVVGGAHGSNKAPVTVGDRGALQIQPQRVTAPPSREVSPGEPEIVQPSFEIKAQGQAGPAPVIPKDLAAPRLDPTRAADRGPTTGELPTEATAAVTGAEPATTPTPITPLAPASTRARAPHPARAAGQDPNAPSVRPLGSVDPSNTNAATPEGAVARVTVREVAATGGASAVGIGAPVARSPVAEALVNPVTTAGVAAPQTALPAVERPNIPAVRRGSDVRGMVPSTVSLTADRSAAHRSLQAEAQTQGRIGPEARGLEATQIAPLGPRLEATKRSVAPGTQAASASATGRGQQVAAGARARGDQQVAQGGQAIAAQMERAAKERARDATALPPAAVQQGAAAMTRGAVATGAATVERVVAAATGTPVTLDASVLGRAAQAAATPSVLPAFDGSRFATLDRRAPLPAVETGEVGAAQTASEATYQQTEQQIEQLGAMPVPVFQAPAGGEVGARTPGGQPTREAAIAKIESEVVARGNAETPGKIKEAANHWQGQLRPKVAAAKASAGQQATTRLAQSTAKANEIRGRKPPMTGGEAAARAQPPYHAHQAEATHASTQMKGEIGGARTTATAATGAARGVRNQQVGAAKQQYQQTVQGQLMPEHAAKVQAATTQFQAQNTAALAQQQAAQQQAQVAAQQQIAQKKAQTDAQVQQQQGQLQSQQAAAVASHDQQVAAANAAHQAQVQQAQTQSQAHVQQQQAEMQAKVAQTQAQGQQQVELHLQQGEQGYQQEIAKGQAKADAERAKAQAAAAAKQAEASSAGSSNAVGAAIDWVKARVNDLLNLAKAILEAAEALVLQIMEAARQAAMAVLEAARQAAMAALAQAQAMIQGIIAACAAAIRSIIAACAALIRSLIQALAAQLQALLAALTALLTTLVAAFQAAVNALLAGLVAAVAAVNQELGNKLRQATEKYRTAFNQACTKLQGDLRAAGQTLQTKIQQVAHEATARVDAAEKSLNDAVTHVEHTLNTAVEHAYQKGAQAIHHAFDAAKRGVNRAFAVAKVVVKAYYDLQLAELRAVKRAVHEVAGFLKSVGTQISEGIAKLAREIVALVPEGATKWFVDFWNGPWRSTIIIGLATIAAAALVVGTGGLGAIFLAGIYGGAIAGSAYFGGELLAREGEIKLSSQGDGMYVPGIGKVQIGPNGQPIPPAHLTPEQQADFAKQATWAMSSFDLRRDPTGKVIGMTPKSGAQITNAAAAEGVKGFGEGFVSGSLAVAGGGIAGNLTKGIGVKAAAAAGEATISKGALLMRTAAESAITNAIQGPVQGSVTAAWDTGFDALRDGKDPVVAMKAAYHAGAKELTSPTAWASAMLMAGIAPAKLKLVTPRLEGALTRVENQTVKTVVTKGTDVVVESMGQTFAQSGGAFVGAFQQAVSGHPPKSVPEALAEARRAASDAFKPEAILTTTALNTVGAATHRDQNHPPPEGEVLSHPHPGTETTNASERPSEVRDAERPRDGSTVERAIDLDPWDSPVTPRPNRPVIAPSPERAAPRELPRLPPAREPLPMPERTQVAQDLDFGSERDRGALWNKQPGRRAAEAAGKNTLETTPGGKHLEELNAKMSWEEVAPEWDYASDRYVQGLGGDVKVYVSPAGSQGMFPSRDATAAKYGGIYRDSVLYRRELPNLNVNPDVTHVTFVHGQNPPAAHGHPTGGEVVSHPHPGTEMTTAGQKPSSSGERAIELDPWESPVTPRADQPVGAPSGEPAAPRELPRLPPAREPPSSPTSTRITQELDFTSERDRGALWNKQPGRRAAEAAGKNTLETTQGGKYLEEHLAGLPWEQFAREWDRPSDRYVQGLSGDVSVYVSPAGSEGPYPSRDATAAKYGGIYRDSVLYRRELPNLNENPNVTHVTFVHGGPPAPTEHVEQAPHPATEPTSGPTREVSGASPRPTGEPAASAKNNRPDEARTQTSLDGQQVAVDIRTASPEARHLIRQLEKRGQVRVSEVSPGALAEASRWFGKELAVLQTPYHAKLRVVLGETNAVLSRQIKPGEVFVVHTHPVMTTKSSHFGTDLAKAGTHVEAVIDWSGQITYYNKSGLQNPVTPDGRVLPLHDYRAAFMDERGNIAGYANIDVTDTPGGVVVKVRELGGEGSQETSVARAVEDPESSSRTTDATVVSQTSKYNVNIATNNGTVTLSDGTVISGSSAKTGSHETISQSGKYSIHIGQNDGNIVITDPDASVHIGNGASQDVQQAGTYCTAIGRCSGTVTIGDKTLPVGDTSIARAITDPDRSSETPATNIAAQPVQPVQPEIARPPGTPRLTGQPDRPALPGQAPVPAYPVRYLGKYGPEFGVGRAIDKTAKVISAHGAYSEELFGKMLIPPGITVVEFMPDGALMRVEMGEQIDAGHPMTGTPKAFHTGEMNERLLLPFPGAHGPNVVTVDGPTLLSSKLMEMWADGYRGQVAISACNQKVINTGGPGKKERQEIIERGGLIPNRYGGGAGPEIYPYERYKAAMRSGQPLLPPAPEGSPDVGFRARDREMGNLQITAPEGSSIGVDVRSSELGSIQTAVGEGNTQIAGEPPATRPGGAKDNVQIADPSRSTLAIRLNHPGRGVNETRVDVTDSTMRGSTQSVIGNDNYQHAGSTENVRRGTIRQRIEGDGNRQTAFDQVTTTPESARVGDLRQDIRGNGNEQTALDNIAVDGGRLSVGNVSQSIAGDGNQQTALSAVAVGGDRTAPRSHLDPPATTSAGFQDPMLPRYTIPRDVRMREPTPVVHEGKPYDVMGVTSDGQLQLRDPEAIQRDVRIGSLPGRDVTYQGETWRIREVVTSRLDVKVELFDPRDRARTMTLERPEEIADVVIHEADGQTFSLSGERHGVMRMAPRASRETLLVALAEGQAFEARLKGHELEGVYVVRRTGEQLVATGTDREGRPVRRVIQPAEIAPRYEAVMSSDFQAPFDVDSFRVQEDKQRGTPVQRPESSSGGLPISDPLFGTLPETAQPRVAIGGKAMIDQFEEFIQRATEATGPHTGRELTLFNISFSTEGEAMRVLDALVAFRARHPDANMRLVVYALGKQEFQRSPAYEHLLATLEQQRIHVEKFEGDDPNTAQVIHAKGIIIDDQVLFSTGAVIDANPKNKADVSFELPPDAAAAFRRYMNEAVIGDASEARRAELLADLAKKGVVLNDPRARLPFITRAQDALILGARTDLTILISEIQDPSVTQLIIDRAAAGVNVTVQNRGLDPASQALLDAAARRYPNLRVEGVDGWDPRPHFNIIIADHVEAYVGSAYLWPTQRNMVHHGRSLENGVILQGKAVELLHEQLGTLDRTARGAETHPPAAPAVATEHPRGDT